MPDHLIASDLKKRYGRGPAVVENFSHGFLPGRPTALVGPNGSGKTTLIRLLTTLSFPTDGRISYGAIDIHQRPAKYLRSVGFVDDSGDLPPYLNAVELLEWVARARGTFGQLGSDGLHRILDEVLLDERRGNLIGTYSSGMTKKTHIAAALAARPDVLILDEPLRGLDTQSREAIEQILVAFAASERILILASHFGDTVERICHDIIRLPV